MVILLSKIYYSLMIDINITFLFPLICKHTLPFSDTNIIVPSFD